MYNICIHKKETGRICWYIQTIYPKIKSEEIEHEEGKRAELNTVLY